MRKYLSLVLCASILFGCAKESDVENLQKQIDELKSDQIASIDAQIASINTSISNLEQTDNQLKEYIADLQETATELQNSISETNESITRVENELKAEIASTEEGLSTDILNAKTELLNDLTALRTEMQGKLDLINTSISNLQAADVNLGERIDQLKTYTDTEIGSAKDWASATFSTLEQYNLTVTEIAGIKANITTINTAISELETRINDKIATDIAQAVSTLEGKLQQQATDITNAYTSAIATAKGEIEAAYTQAIQTAISNSESSMQSWVNDKLTGYYTIAQTDAKLTSLKETLEAELNSQKEYLEEKISNLESSLTVKIEANGALIEGLQTQVNGLSSDLASLAETVAANSRSISQNAADIATNARNIAANASNINQCEQLIAANSRLIEANTTAIGENSAAITALQSRLATDEQSISTNATNIAKNAANIAANAEAIATNTAAIINNTRAISTNAANIANLQSSLAAAITDITTAYNNAISAAITENNGVINAKIAADIATAQAALQQQIDAINTRISNLESRIDTLEETVADILNTVQDIVVIPTYTDGSVACSKLDNEFYFDVLPSGAAARLAAAGKNIFSLKAVNTLTKAVPSLVQMPISSVRAEGNILVIVASGANLDFYPSLSANACLYVTSGAISKSTGYFQLTAKIEEPEAVDLGLSVKWASFNLGAYAPEEYGLYYAWGEKSTKTDYRWLTYKFGSSETSLTKYNTLSDYGIVDNSTQLTLSDDVARQELGDKWRLPTKKEAQELIDNCSATWTTQNGVKGYLFTSDKSGFTDKSIFLPAAGYWDESTHKSAETNGYYWFSSVIYSNPSRAEVMSLSSNSCYTSQDKRYYGQSIRPVYGNTVSLNRNYLTLYEGETAILGVSVEPQDAAAQGFSWESANSEVATVSSSGRVTAVSTGTTTITVSCGGQSSYCIVKVTGPVTSVKLDLGHLLLEVGQVEKLKATVSPTNADNKDVTWSSSSPSVASVTSNGEVTALSLGTTDIIVTTVDGGKTATCHVTVVDKIYVTSGPAVDLGLSVKWASCNLCESGFVSYPEDYGDYYAWGEKETYYSSQTPLAWKIGKTSGYSWASYSLCNGTSSSLTKYNNNSSYGTVDNKTQLELSDDAARQKLGGKWRMPTDADWTKLRTQCTWTWVTLNGVKGYLITSTNGNNIFLPAAGNWTSTSFSSFAGSYGYYWSSSLSTSRPDCACYVQFGSSTVQRGTSYHRYIGFSVRPVTD